MAKLFKVLKSEEDLTAFSLTRVFNGREIPVANTDFQKEFKLKQTCLNWEYFTADNYYYAIQHVYKFKTI